MPCPYRWLLKMVGQPGKAGTEEYTEEFGFITEENGTRAWFLYGGAFQFKFK